jgi:hypothetical protein
MSVNDNVIRFGLFPNSLIVLNLFDCERGELEGFVARRRKLQLSDLIYVPVPTTAHSSHPQIIFDRTMASYSRQLRNGGVFMIHRLVSFRTNHDGFYISDCSVVCMPSIQNNLDP